MKKIIVLLLVLTLGLALVACGGETPCTEHVDADANGECDSCGAAVETEDGEGNGGGSQDASVIELIKNGAATFQIVSTEDTSIEIGRPLSNLVKNINDCIDEANVKAVFEHISPKETEIIFGNVTSRGDKYTLANASPYAYGYEGWSVKIVDGRAKTEASGNMGDRDLREVAETGVDIISIGALTHSVRSLDISLKFTIN